MNAMGTPLAWLVEVAISSRNSAAASRLSLYIWLPCIWVSAETIAGFLPSNILNMPINSCVIIWQLTFDILAGTSHLIMSLSVIGNMCT